MKKCIQTSSVLYFPDGSMAFRLIFFIGKSVKRPTDRWLNLFFFQKCTFFVHFSEHFQKVTGAGSGPTYAFSCSQNSKVQKQFFNFAKRIWMNSRFFSWKIVVKKKLKAYEVVADFSWGGVLFSFHLDFIKIPN